MRNSEMCSVQTQLNIGNIKETNKRILKTNEQINDDNSLCKSERICVYALRRAYTQMTY